MRAPRRSRRTVATMPSLQPAARRSAVSVTLVLGTLFWLSSCDAPAHDDGLVDTASIDDRCDGPAARFGTPIASHRTTVDQIRDWIGRDPAVPPSHDAGDGVLLCWHDQPAADGNTAAERTAVIVYEDGWAGAISGPPNELPVERP